MRMKTKPFNINEIELMFTPLGTAPQQLSDLYDKIEYDNDIEEIQNISKNISIRIMLGSKTLYDSKQIPKNGYIREYVIMDSNFQNFFNEIGEFRHTDFPYTFINTPMFAQREYKEEIDALERKLQEAGAVKLFNSMDVLTITEKREYRYTGHQKVPQPIIDNVVYEQLIGSMEERLCDIGKKLGTSAPRERNARIYSLFASKPDVRFGDKILLSLLDEHLQIKGKTREYAFTPPPSKLTFDEKLASPSVLENARLFVDLIILVDYFVTDAVNRQVLPELPDDESSLYGVEMSLQEFGDKEALFSYLDAYNDGVPVEDIVA